MRSSCCGKLSTTGRCAARFISLLLALTLLFDAFTQYAAAAEPTLSKPKPAQVFVIGSLYSRHRAAPAYDLNALRRVVLAIAPDVVVVDCTPTEIREQRVHASKIEYPEVIFPLVQQHGYRVYAGEPDEPLFTQIVQPLAQARNAFAKANPEHARILHAYDSATWAALSLHWRSPADAHDEVTALALAGRKGLDTRSHGDIQRQANAQWIEHWGRIVRQAATENPGKKILAVAGIDNRLEIERAVSADPSVAIVDMQQWLRGANL